MSYTRIDVERLIQTNDTAAANALVKLVRAGVRFGPVDTILYSFAAQVIDAREAGRERLLSPKQLQIWRRRSVKFGAELVKIANREG